MHRENPALAGKIVIEPADAGVEQADYLTRTSRSPREIKPQSHREHGENLMNFCVLRVSVVNPFLPRLYLSGSALSAAGVGFPAFRS